ncbi:MAG: lytic transglycosylase [Desulfobulbus propionicus]|nr:MAG: lytic transglycosylase [Desulfobulbus propionicus]
MRYSSLKITRTTCFYRFIITTSVVFWIFCTPSASLAQEPFPAYQIIQPNVAFWEKVYGQYHSRQAILHDRDNLNIIYTVIELVSWEAPGSARINQKLIKLARQQIKNILYALGHGKPPTTKAEKRIAALFPKQLHTTYLTARDNIRLQIGQKDRFEQGVVRSGKYIGTIKTIFKQYGLPEMLAYLPHVESSFNPQAHSKAGAFGLWQFTRSTGRNFMTINEQIDQRLDPFTSTHAAAKLLKENYAQLGNWPLAITAYNYGRYGMMRAVKECKNYPSIFANYQKGYFKFASRNFYSEFLAACKVAKQLEHNPNIKKAQPEKTTPFTLHGDTSSLLLRNFFNISKQTFARLNPALKHPLLKGISPIPAGYTVKLPSTKQVLLKKNKWKKSMYVLSEYETKTYTVKKGDSLSTLAKKYKTTVKQIKTLNNLDNVALIQLGQKLILPGKGRIFILKNNSKKRPS